MALDLNSRSTDSRTFASSFCSALVVVASKPGLSVALMETIMHLPSFIAINVSTSITLTSVSTTWSSGATYATAAGVEMLPRVASSSSRRSDRSMAFIVYLNIYYFGLGFPRTKK